MVKKVVKKETVTEQTEEAAEPGKVKKVTTTTTTSTASKKKKRKKRKYHRKKSSSSGKKQLTAREREELLIENFVGIQHAMTNLSIKFGALSDNISNLLMVFEEAAKNFAEGGKSDDKDMLRKINSLLDQNKTIARGLVLMESKLRGRATDSPGEPSIPAPPAPPNPPSYPPMDRPRPRPLPSI